LNAEKAEPHLMKLLTDNELPTCVASNTDNLAIRPLPTALKLEPHRT
jgi:hypothetical protein